MLDVCSDEHGTIFTLKNLYDIIIAQLFRSIATLKWN